MVKILAFGGSSSTKSINKQLVDYTIAQIAPTDTLELEVIDFSTPEFKSIPMFDVEREAEEGVPAQIKTLVEKIRNADKLIISMSEHNQGPTAFMKNVLDWSSRVMLKFFEGKQILLLSTSPGGYGGQNARNFAERLFSTMFGGSIYKTFSVGLFYKNFGEGKIIEAGIDAELKQMISDFVAFVPPTADEKPSA